VIFTAFKAVDSALRGSNGGFDSHTLPPDLASVYAMIEDPIEWSDLEYLAPVGRSVLRGLNAWSTRRIADG
jgi:hypothetical protein